MATVGGMNARALASARAPLCRRALLLPAGRTRVVMRVGEIRRPEYIPNRIDGEPGLGNRWAIDERAQ